MAEDFKAGGELGQFVKRSESFKTADNNYTALVTTAQDDYLGYNGVVSMPGSKGSVDFS